MNQQTNLDDQTNIYDHYEGEYQAQKNAGILISIVNGFIRDSILDIGAADGSLLKALQKKGYHNVKGIDIVPKSAIIEKGNITNIPFADNSFQTVFCTEVIEHLDSSQIETGLKEIQRVLKNDGQLIFTVPYKENRNVNAVVCPKCLHKFHRYGHLQFFDDKSILDILTEYDIVFLKVYALGAMSVLPLGRYFNWLFKRLDYESIPKTLIIVAKVRKQ